jgi:hypothetical protein
MSFFFFFVFYHNTCISLSLSLSLSVRTVSSICDVKAMSGNRNETIRQTDHFVHRWRFLFVCLFSRSNKDYMLEMDLDTKKVFGLVFLTSFGSIVCLKRNII